MARIVLVLALFAGAAFATPAASAQVPTQFPAALQLSIHPFDAPIVPETGRGVATLSIDYAYFSPGGLTTTSATRVEVRVTEHPAWATVTVSPTEVLIPIQPLAGPATTTSAPTQTVEVRVVVTDDAPAFVPANLRIEAIAHPNGAIAPAQADVQTLVQADYAGYLGVAGAPSTISIERGGSVTVPVTITNFANGPTKVSASAERPIPGLHVEGLLPFTLDSRQSGGAGFARTVPVTLYADDDFETATAVVRLVGRYALNDAISLEPITMRFRIEASGAPRAPSIFGGGSAPESDGSLVEAQSARFGAAPGGLPLTLALVGALGGAWIGVSRWKRSP